MSATESPVLGRYRLRGRVGAGGYGTVFLAFDDRLEREVAVKVVPRERVRGGRLEHEARAAARLSHPGIVTLYEAAVDEGAAYLVSEFVRGTTLADLLSAGALSDREIVRIAIVLCDALTHAHGLGIVHRDVKPANVLIPDQASSPAGLAKLTDFGVARIVGGDAVTRTGDVVGTAAYMAPEQAEGLEAGAAADLYSLALVVYEALTGVNPVRTLVSNRRARRLGAHLPPLRRQRRELPRELAGAIDLALRPRPRERGTIEELRGALRSSLPQLGTDPGVVGPPTRMIAAAGRSGGFPRGARDAGPGKEERRGEAQSRGEGDPGGEWGHPGEGDSREQRDVLAPAWAGRALAASAAAAAAVWLATHALSSSPLAPGAIALLAGGAVLCLPRVGWMATVTALCLTATIQGRSGAALVLLIAALLPVLLLARRGNSWPLPAAAPSLGLIGLAGAYPAIAAGARGAWRRGALGALGWFWLLLAAPLAHSPLYMRAPGSARPSAGWAGSPQAAIDLVLRPIASSGAVWAAGVWALGAVVLPWIVRGRSLAADLIAAALWAMVIVLATRAEVAVGAPVGTTVPVRAAAAGAVVSVLVALAPTLVRSRRVLRAPA